ncbi:hypothetical protein GW17_00000923 [Ensete ventricosum]|nr:hypothetical protein GW17_00000923 [Ensete ventricosum]
MSQERPSHQFSSRLTEEALPPTPLIMAAPFAPQVGLTDVAQPLLIPDRYWRLLNDPGLTPPYSTSYAFDGLHGGVPLPIPLGPGPNRDDTNHHLTHPPVDVVAGSSSVGAPAAAYQTRWLSGTCGVGLSCPTTRDLTQETRAETSSLVPEKSATPHLGVEHTMREPDMLSSDTTDSLRAQLWQVNKRLD